MNFLTSPARLCYVEGVEGELAPKFSGFPSWVMVSLITGMGAPFLLLIPGIADILLRVPHNHQIFLALLVSLAPR